MITMITIVTEEKFEMLVCSFLKLFWLHGVQLFLSRWYPLDLMKESNSTCNCDIPFIYLCCSVLYDLQSCLKNLGSSGNLQGLRLSLPKECKHMRGRQGCASSGHRNWQKKKTLQVSSVLPWTGIVSVKTVIDNLISNLRVVTVVLNGARLHLQFEGFLDMRT